MSVKRLTEAAPPKRRVQGSGGGVAAMVGLGFALFLGGAAIVPGGAAFAQEWGLRTTPAALAQASPGEASVAPASVAPAVASGVKVGAEAGRTVLSFTLSRPAAPRAFVLADPDRVVIDLPDVQFAQTPGDEEKRAADNARRRPAGLVRAWRHGSMGAGRSRIVVDLAGPVKILRAELGGAQGLLSYRLELAPSDRAAFTQAAREGARIAADIARAQPAPAPSATPSDDDRRPVIVLDPGHGGIDTGALGRAKAFEKTIVLGFSQALAKGLEATGRYKVILTRTEDVFVPLGERVRIARAARAKLFLSIHADSLNLNGVSGATVYTVSDRASDAHAAKLADKENQVDKLAGFEGLDGVSEVSDILFDLTRRETRAFSHVFARSLVAYFGAASRLNKNPLRSAGFVVLKAPDVPSVLLELGYLTSKDDADLLTQPEWRDKAVAEVIRSVDAFFAPPPGKPAGATGSGASVGASGAGVVPGQGVAAAIQR